MQPPSKRNNAAKGYRGLINARVPPKRNEKRNPNDNEHYYSARVKYAREACSMFPESSTMFSVDNKNKLRVSSCAPAVDRRCTLSRIFPTDDSPNLFDHDFPTPGYLITPAGYMEMKPPSVPEFTLDKMGRQRYRLPECIAINVINRGPYIKTTIASHCNDLYPLIQQSKKSSVTILSDGGCDFNVNHLTNEWFFMRLFKDLNLDVLLATAHCPGFSARNPIEHVWGVLTNAAIAVYLPDRLQQHLTGEALKAKEGQVFDAALSTLEGYWGNVRYAGVKIAVSHQSSKDNPTPYSADDHSRIHTLMTGPYKNIKEADMHSDMCFFKRHIDRRVGMVIFTKCQLPDQCDHCSRFPIKNPEAVAMYKQFPSPTPSTSFPGHFHSFIEALQLDRGSPDEHMPQCQEKQLGTCPDCKFL